MGRNKKHQKEIRQEKSKTKLRTKLTKTKFLPKGLNVTDVNFKVKPIVILEQLKPTTEKTLADGNQSLKETLTQFNHHNVSMRYRACENLIQLITQSPTQSLEENLYIIFQGMTKLLIDIEMKVRQKAICELQLLLEKVSHISAAPFYDLLTSYALCAMTHINKAIQEDSLMIIDVYLHHAPDLIIKNFDKIFTNFLTLVSKLQNESKLTRTLTINLQSKITSIKWRNMVLSRLNRILKLVMQRKNQEPSNSAKCKTVTCPASFIPMYRRLRDVYEGVVEDDKENEYTKVLLPLLYETWAEAAPIDEIKYRENGAMMIDSEAASILSCVVGIFCTLIDLAKSSNEAAMRKLFSSKENKLLSHFLNQFPYRQSNHGGKRNKESSKVFSINADPNCVEENLLICYAFCSVNKMLVHPNTQRAKALLDYINLCLSTRGYVPSQSVTTISQLLQIILFDNYNSWKRNLLFSEKLLDNIVNFYNNLPNTYENKKQVFNLLIDVAKKTEIPKSNKFAGWLHELPLLLLKPEISVEFVDTLSLLARQNNKPFLESLEKSLPEFLGNLPKIKVQDDDLPPAPIKLINMLYYIPLLNCRNIELFESFVNCFKDWEFVEHFKQLLLERIK